jgi:hypothetical protein
MPNIMPKKDAIVISNFKADKRLSNAYAFSSSKDSFKGWKSPKNFSLLTNFFEPRPPKAILPERRGSKYD